ncbi:WD repeat-containing protein [Reticulomyxa filosa]|uniref:WD repeat-containing protein n=1 Tax=Reticulomyxa filosa TaxID=46433 RepID=X6MQ29_RETFI|nr:WD repeat-containing protein [Reticulomyxa filosa]|eukprot:ETO15205.1 WD repeat-containing protein [Reticulomyxa filosa]
MKKEHTGQNSSSLFETLPTLPFSFRTAQSVSHKDEIIICGDNNGCYSYHTLKNQYKLICPYPKEVKLNGHCVVKIVHKDNKNVNEVTLLSFGGQGSDEKKYTLIMKYISVWNNNGKITSKDYNKWIPFRDNKNNEISIGKHDDNYMGVRAIIGGKNNNLLFITYWPWYIDVFNLNTCQYIKSDNLPTNCCAIQYHAFVTKTKGEKEDNNICEMLLFYKNIGLNITYDENSNIFCYQNIRVCTSLRAIILYSYVYANDSILFFGGKDDSGTLKEIYKYFVINNKWMKFEHALPIPLSGACAILNENNTKIYIFGGKNPFQTKVKKWMKKETKRERQWIDDENERRELEEINVELQVMKEGSDMKKLKRMKEMEIIIGHWVRSLSIDLGWIHEFNIVISRYLMRKYFKQLRILQGHSDIVSGVKFSHDGTKIVSTSVDGTVRIWDVMSRKQIGIWGKQSKWTNHAKFSPHDDMIVFIANPNLIILLDVQSCAEINKFEGPDNMLGIQFLPNGKNIVLSSCDTTIRIWDIKSGQEIKKLETHTRLEGHFQISFDGQQLISALYDYTIGIWNLQSGEMIHKLKGHCSYINNIQLSPDCRFIVSCSGDKTIRIWDIISGLEVQKFDEQCYKIGNVQFFPDGNTIFFSLTDKNIQLFDVKLGIGIQTIENLKYVVAADISSNGNNIVSSSYDRIIELWGLL